MLCRMKIRAITCFITIHKTDDINLIRNKIEKADNANKFISECLMKKGIEVWETGTF